jgi:hypothetical protein
MSSDVRIAIDFGPDTISAQWRIGSRDGEAFCWEAPVPVPGGLPFHATDDGHALILEVLALVHFPNVDTLVLALPAPEVETHRARLQQACTGVHDVRNTECRSQRLAVRVRRVEVVPHNG